MRYLSSISLALIETPAIKQLSLIIPIATLVVVMSACGGSSGWSEAERAYNKGKEKQVAASEVMEAQTKSTADSLDLKAFLNSDAYDDFVKAHQEAISHFTKAIELDPDYAFAYNRRGGSYTWIFAEQVDYIGNAINDYTKAIELDPDYGVAYTNRGDAYTILRQYQNANSDFTKAIQLGVDYFRNYQQRGLNFYELGQYQLAIDDYDKVIQLDPNSAMAYSDRGLSYRSLGQYTLADADKTKACSLDSKYC